MKNQLKETEERLLKTYEAREIAPWMNRLHALADSVDVHRRAGGIAIFANPDFGRVMYLATPLEERVIIDDNFATREIVRALLTSPRYRVLSLTEESGATLRRPPRPFARGRERAFSDDARIEGVETELTSTYGVEVSELQKSQQRDFAERVEKALKDVSDHDPLPLALVGVERTLASFDAATSKQSDEKFNVIARMHGNYEKVGIAELEGKLWPLVQPNLNGARERAKERLEEAVGVDKAAFGLGKVWEHANTGRVDTLLVERDYIQSARVMESEMPFGTLEACDNCDTKEPDVLPDAVDEIVELVMKNSGDVVFVDHEELAQPGHIAAILRY